MSLQPTVELHFHPTDLNPRDLARTGPFLGSPAEALQAALGATRVMMVDRMKTELAAQTGDVGVDTLVNIADLAWQANFWKFRRISAPMMADAYVRAYRKANAGDVPTSVVYDLADKHAERIGEYFHTSSKQAMVEGFNSYVNRRIATRAAASRVLDAYGLTPRQMGGYVSATASMDAKVTSREKRSLKAKVLDYIVRSFRRRVKSFAAQEEHNIDQQAQQFAWMWLMDKGRLNPAAEKVWITAHDEKVCKVCGPLHGQKVGVNEQFTSGDLAFWTPGVHPNCRCHVRLIENKFTIVKALAGSQLQQFNRRHPRDREGQFSDLPDQPRSTAPTLVDPEWLKAVELELAQEQEKPQWESSDWGEGDQWDTWSDWAEEETEPQRTRTRAPKLKRQKVKQKASQKEKQVQTQPVVSTQGWSQETWAPETWAQETWSPEVVEQLQEQNPALTTEQIALSSMAFDRAVKEIIEDPPKTEEAIRNTIPVAGDPKQGDNLIYYWNQDLDLPEEEGRVRFGTDEAWVQGRDGQSEIKRRIAVQMNSEINSTLNTILLDSDNQYQRIKGDEYVNIRIPGPLASELTGEQLQGSQRIRFSADELRGMLTATANKTEMPDIRDKPVWSAEAPTEAVTGVVRAPGNVLLEGMGITPENFEQTIYVASEGHSGFDTGEGLEPIGRDLGMAMEAYQNPGDFEVKADSSSVTNQGPYRFVHVDPVEPVKKVPIAIEDLKRTSPDWP